MEGGASMKVDSRGEASTIEGNRMEMLSTSVDGDVVTASAEGRVKRERARRKEGVRCGRRRVDEKGRRSATAAAVAAAACEQQQQPLRLA